MSTATYKVAEILGEREWAPADDPSKKTVYWEFRADGLDKVYSIGRKPGNDLKIGESFDAEVKSEKNGKVNLKRVQPGGGFGGGGNGGSKSYEADPKKMRAEAMRSALHAASGYVIAAKQAGEDAKADHVDALARRWYALIIDAMEEA